MAFLLGGANSAAADTGFAVDNSCRFNDGDTATLEKALGTPTSQKKFTFSCWFKRGVLSGDQSLFSCGSSGDDEWNDFRLGSGGEIQWYIDRDESYYLTTDRLFRDVSAWYNFIIAVDTTQGTDTNRVKLYVNGVQEATANLNVTGYPAQDYDLTAMASGENVSIGKRQKGGALNLDGYLAEACFIDGLALSPTSFGEFDEDSPSIWKPIDVSELTFGNNGFYLDFDDSSNLGNDKNGGTDLTEANLAAADQATDSPTNNFCVMNPLANFLAGATFSEGNCQVVTVASNSTFVEGTFGVTTGKWYWEGKNTAGSSVYNDIGITGAPSTSAGSDYLGYTANAYGYQAINGNYRHNSGASPTGTSYGDAFAVNDIIGVALNLDDNELTFYKNGTAQASGTAIDINAASTTTQGVWMPAVGDGYNQAVGWAMNFGGCSAFAVSSANQDGAGYGNFEYGVPSGFFALCTKNLAEYG